MGPIARSTGNANSTSTHQDARIIKIEFLKLHGVQGVVSRAPQIALHK